MHTLTSTMKNPLILDKFTLCRWADWTNAHCFLEDRLVAQRFSRQFDRNFFVKLDLILTKLTKLN